MTLLYDKPLDDPSDDVLGRVPFARSIADAIVSMDATEGFVFAIHGPWGSGKTTALNFILHELQRHDPNPATVVRFNPWWFSGRDQLIQQFFNAFRDGLGSKSQASQIAGLAEDLDRFSRALEIFSKVVDRSSAGSRLRA